MPDYKTPAESRTLLDVYSKGQVDTAIGASAAEIGAELDGTQDLLADVQAALAGKATVAELDEAQALLAAVQAALAGKAAAADGISPAERAKLGALPAAGALAADLADKLPASARGAPNGVADLNGDGHLPISRIAPKAIDDSRRADLPDGTFSARRPGAGAGTPQQVTVAQARLDLGITPLEAQVGGLQSAMGDQTPRARLLTTTGLLTGGGDLSANRTLSVPKASPADVAGRTDDAKALTAYAVADALEGLRHEPGPGLSPTRYRRGLAAGSALWDEDDVVATPEGYALRLDGPGYVVLDEAVRLGPSDRDQVIFQVRRGIAVTDPAGDGVRFGVACFGADGALLPGADGFVRIGDDLLDLTAAGSTHWRTGSVSRAPGADVVLPALARSYAPAVRSYGESAGLDVLECERHRLTGAGTGAGVSLTPDAAGTLAGRAAHDAAAVGFVYLAADGATWDYYVRTGSAGTWSGPQTFRGPTGQAGSDAALSFASHAAALAWLTAAVRPDGIEFSAAGAPFVTASAASMVPTLPGARPRGPWSARHWGGIARSHLAAAHVAWKTAFATAFGAYLAAAGAVPFLFTAGDIVNAGGAPYVFDFSGSDQEVVFEPGARAENVSFRVNHSGVQIDRPDLHYTADVDFGIEVDGGVNIGTGLPNPIRGGTIDQPRIKSCRNAAKTARSIHLTGDNAHIAILRPYLVDNDYNLDITSTLGGLLSGGHLLNARRNNYRAVRFGEMKMIGTVVRGSAEIGILLKGTNASRTLEHYFTDVTATGNHTDLSTRWSWPVLSVENDGSGNARFAVASHKGWDGLRNMVIQGTGLYDGTYAMRMVTDTKFLLELPGTTTKVAFAGTATGTLIHCGFDGWAEGDPGFLARCNDIFINGGNFNSFGASDAYNVNSSLCRHKDNFWVEGTTNMVSKIGFGRGRNDDTWEDVPIAGKASGFSEVMSMAPGATGPASLGGFVIRYPRTAAGLLGNLPVAYNRVYVSSTGVILDGPVSGDAVMASQLDATLGRLMTVGAFGLGAATLPAITDFAAAILPGLYKVDVAAVAGAPAGLASGTGRCLVIGDGVGTEFRLSYLNGAITAPWYQGHRLGATGAVVWVEALSPHRDPAFARYSADTASRTIFFRKTRSTVGPADATAPVQAGDFLGRMSFEGADGSAFVEAARVRAEVAGPVSAGVVPAHLDLYTRNLAGTLARRARLTSEGRLGVGVDAPTCAVHANGAIRPATFARLTLPDAAAAGAGAFCDCSDLAGGSELVRSDGTNWRRFSDRSIAS